MFLSAAPWLMVVLTLWPTQINGQRFHNWMASCHLHFFCCLISLAAVDCFLEITSCSYVDGSFTGCRSQKTGNENTHTANSRERKLLHAAVSKWQAVQGKFVRWHYLFVLKHTDNSFRNNFGVKLQSLIIKNMANNVCLKNVQDNQFPLLAGEVKKHVRGRRRTKKKTFIDQWGNDNHHQWWSSIITAAKRLVPCKGSRNLCCIPVDWILLKIFCFLIEIRILTFEVNN